MSLSKQNAKNDEEKLNIDNIVNTFHDSFETGAEIENPALEAKYLYLQIDTEGLLDFTIYDKDFHEIDGGGYGDDDDPISGEPEEDEKIKDLIKEMLDDYGLSENDLRKLRIPFDDFTSRTEAQDVKDLRKQIACIKK